VRTAFVERASAPRERIAAWRAFLLACGRRLRVGPGEVSVLLCHDGEIAELNRRFLGKDRPTDVLSFPDHARDPGKTVHIGDIAICLDAARRQARGAHRSLDEEVKRLLIHGLLHLLGYDHERDHGEMTALESELRGELLAESR
jgi:rRNA maturation RNase YbeY